MGRGTLGHKPEQSSLEMQASERDRCPGAAMREETQGRFEAHRGVACRWTPISIFLPDVGDLLFTVFPNGILLEL